MPDSDTDLTTQAADALRTAPRLFVAGALSEGAVLAGNPAQAHHLGGVLRHGPGDAVRLFNGVDGEFAARIEKLRKGNITFAVGPRLRPQALESDVWLAFALLKRDATDLVAEKATELGAARLLPVLCARGQAGRVNLDRLRAIATSAAEQSERLTVPMVHEPVTLPDLLGAWPAGRRLAAAIERAPGLPCPVSEGALLTGPEGGFTPGELDALRAAPFIQRVSLGPRVLRAETAAIAGLALLLAR